MDTRIYEAPEFILAEAGTQLKMNCDSSCLPKWYKNTTDHWTFLVTSHLLTFLNITTEDRGLYFCKGNGWDKNQTEFWRWSNLQIGCTLATIILKI